MPSALPGIVIFVHGVNDPGGSYDIIEEGLCEGLNERLDAFRLVPGVYGEKYRAAQASKLKFGESDYKNVADVKYDPDTYLYERLESGGDIGTKTHSIFVPFYWGYRAAENEIARQAPEEGGTPDGYKVKRGQYLDIYGNRLSKHFAKGGGMFNNATTSLPLMFEEGFHANLANAAAKTQMSGYEYSGESPHRRYMVLAAERLALLVREMRTMYPDETINIMGHSQGTLVTLLAQAMLAEGSPERHYRDHVIPALPPARPADCLILVDSPYSLIETFAEKAAKNNRKRYTARGRLKTLLNIVRSVTSKPHDAPALTTLSPATEGNREHQGRAGMRWRGTGDATRRERNGTRVPFVERDNRGKVYMYFCPEDASVDILTIKGIGTHGVPDQLKDGSPAMEVLKDNRFYQRVWTRRETDDNGSPVLVGQSPGYVSFKKRPPCFINAEAIHPPYAPKMYGGEVVHGTPDKAGRVLPNDYARDLLIGNPDESVPFVLLQEIHGGGVAPRADDAMQAFNKKKDPNDQTYAVHVRTRRDPTGCHPNVYRVLREETPNETRERIARDESMWQDNSYHSAVLTERDNLRRVAAFDIAVGQAKSLDDENARALFIALADWKMGAKVVGSIQGNSMYGSLSIAARALIEGCYQYYRYGDFPVPLVRSSPPSTISTDMLR